jgi:hypothetical protein
MPTVVSKGLIDAQAAQEEDWGTSAGQVSAVSPAFITAFPQLGHWALEWGIMNKWKNKNVSIKRHFFILT